MHLFAPALTQAAARVSSAVRTWSPRITSPYKGNTVLQKNSCSVAVREDVQSDNTVTL